MRHYLLLFLGFFVFTAIYAQKKDFTYKFYGQVRGDLFYNSRANAEIVDGLFHLYPKDIAPDADGKDLNATANGSFYLLYSRLGIDITGPDIGKAATSVKIEGDFRGAGSNWAVLRVRHAYVNLDWGKSSVLIGQTWHPLFGEVFPQMLNLSTGAPFQPFNRSPLLRYRYKNGNWQLTGAAVWQLQYLSAGPNGKSEEYIKNSCVPEFYAGVDYKKPGWMVGAGVELLSLVPRTQNEINGKIYKVSERVTSLSAEAHVKYQNDNWLVMAKTLLASNLTQTCMLGGYGVTSVDPRTGEQEYAPYRHSMTWLNIVYGKKWKPGLFLGYLKNMGAGESLVGKTYGVGLDVDQVFTANIQMSYNLPHWKIGIEYSPSLAWYGDVDMQDGGKIYNTHSVTNHRLLGVCIFMF
ncbi:DcaP family trimeric outer membrane transporter [Parabacteroides bouchesdurhonensis]|uniref:DcaP family trimeric outer membrane transporter n=1 Tax=Parabacteroides bouchesdurhonensis TaxID=1936995 RepID=UPI000C8161A6|nr:DcaP family trimeric outer membrane transporter [Parabacteroides bouchesdurhonensis]